MNSSATEIGLASCVGLRSLHASLRARGWIRDQAASRETADVYAWPEDDREAAIVPASEAYSDYGLRVHQIADQIGRMEGRPRLAVLSDLSLVESDVVRLHLPNARGDHTVGLRDGARVLQEAQNLLLAAACSAVRPQRMYRTERDTKASKYLDRVRMEHTVPGSFVINLLSPVAPALSEEGKLMPNEPFERTVTRKLASGLGASRRAMDRVNRGVADISEFEGGLAEGISANLCRSIASLTVAGQGLEVSVSWAMTGPFKEDPGEFVAVAFSLGDVDVLDEAAHILADRQERIGQEIQGYVSRLARDQSAAEGEATIKAIVDGTFVSVRTVFGEEDYTRIIRAHEARLSVSLVGDLLRKGQRWHLRNPRGIAIIEDDD